MNQRRSRMAGLSGAAIGVMILFAALTCGGCASLAFSSQELELLEASAADARFMDRTWTERCDAERRQFVHENAQQWTYFSDLVHGRRPASVGDLSQPATASDAQGAQP